MATEETEKEPDYFHIDKHRLDEECVNQVRMFRKHVDYQVQAKKQLKIAEASEKVIRAEVLLDVKRHPEKFNLESPKVDEIKAAVETDERVKKATWRLIKAEHDVEIHKADIETLNQRKSGLENLVKLWLADYFAEVRTPKGELGEVYNRRERENAFRHPSKQRGGNA